MSYPPRNLLVNKELKEMLLMFLTKILTAHVFLEKYVLICGVPQKKKKINKQVFSFFFENQCR